jgi:hypothetical protein
VEDVAGEIERSGMRASDADRSAVAERLQRAVDEGRLDLTDYDERLQQTYAAKTYGELDRITADLPAPSAALTTARDGAVVERTDAAAEWRSWAGTSIVLIAIWGITSVAAGGAIFFWPMFPVGIWAAILLASMLERRSKDT